MNKVEVSGPRVYRLLYPHLVTLISCTNPETGKPNIITISWSVPLSAVPQLVGVSISPKRYSHQMIEKTKEFVVNVPTMEILEKVVGCGTISGRVADKFEKFGLTPRKAKAIKTPAIEECVAHLECKLVDKVKTGDHTLFIGEVLAAYVNEGIFKDGLYELEKVEEIYQIGGHDYCTLDPRVRKPT